MTVPIGGAACDGHECPPVVNTDEWGLEPPSFDRDVPTVLQIGGPSNDGTTSVLANMADAGLITYRHVHSETVVAADAWGQADVVVVQPLDIPTYSMPAVRALVAGRIVIGHLGSEIREQLGDCPIVEARPSTVGEVLQDLMADREARDLHDGRRSALVFAEAMQLAPLATQGEGSVLSAYAELISEQVAAEPAVMDVSDELGTPDGNRAGMVPISQE